MTNDITESRAFMAGRTGGRRAMQTNFITERWIDEMIDHAHRTGFLVGAGLTGVVWILCTLWGR